MKIDNWIQKARGFYKKTETIPLQMKAVVWFTICNFFVRGINFITAPIYTRVLSADAYGTVSIYNSYQQILLIFTTWELSLGAYTRGYLKYQKRQKEFTSNLLLLSNFITLVCLGPALLLRKIYFRLTDTGIMVLLLSFLLFLVQPSYNCWMYRKRYACEYKPVVFMTIILSLSTAIIPLFAVLGIRNSANIKIVSTLLVQILIYFPIYIRSVDVHTAIKDKEFYFKISKFSLRFQLPLLMHSLSFLILGQSDRMMIGEMVNKSSAGIYSVAYSLATIVTIFQSSINQIFQPYRYRKMEEQNAESIRRSTNILLLILSSVILCFILIAPEAVALLFPEEYYEAIWTIPPISVSVFFMFLYTIFVDVESYNEKTDYVMYASVICAIINIILNYFGIKVFGYIACSYTTLISYMLFSCMHYYFMKKTCKIRGIQEKYFDTKVILLISIAVLIGGVAITIFYNMRAVRSILFAVIILCIFLKKRSIYRLLFFIKNK